MSFIVAVQSLLLTNTRTGNAVIDTVLASLLVMIFGYITQHIHRICSCVQEIVMNRAGMVFGGCKHSITINQMIKNGTWRETNNDYYTAVSWYITDVLKWDRGPLNAHRHSNEHHKSIIPAVGNVFTFDHAGATVTGSMGSTRRVIGNVETVSEFVSLTCRGRGAKPLLDFIEDIHAQFLVVRDEVTWCQKHFSIVYNDVRKIASWEGTKTNSTKSWEAIVMDERVKTALVQDVRSFLDSETWYADTGLAWTRGYLFHGPPGTGKTSCGLAISHEAKMDLYNLDLNLITSNEHLSLLVKLIPNRAIIVMEDVDAMSDVVLSRGSNAAVPSAATAAATATATATADVTNTADAALSSIAAAIESAENRTSLTLSALLNMLNGMVCGHGRIVIMTTNHVQKLDPALVRPGRIDLKVYLGPCSVGMIISLFSKFFGVDQGVLMSRVLEGIRLTEVAANLLTPAEVSSIFLMNRCDPAAATATLLQALAPKQSSDVSPDT